MRAMIPRLVGLALAAPLFFSPVADIAPTPVLGVALAEDGEGESRGEAEMLREEQHERYRDELDAGGDREERAQDREERQEERGEEREDERQEGDGGIERWFNR